MGQATKPELATLETEVLALTRRGLRTTNPPETPALRELLNIPEELSSLQCLPMIRASIVEAAKVLPLEHRVVFHESCGAKASSPFGRERRLEAAGRAVGISARTARRWSEELAPGRIAAQLLADTERVMRSSSFAVTQLHAWLDLTTAHPVLSFLRRIRVLAPRMETFHEEVFLPDLRDGLPSWQGLEGCELERVVDLEHCMWGTEFRFSRPLRLGQTHHFSTSIRLPNHASLRPELAFRPHNTTLNAVVDIRFGSRLPSRIETFRTTASSGLVPQSHVTSTRTLPQQRERFEFDEIQLGFGLGIRWFMED
ncbi:MAG: hypothetical protein Q4D96_10815 [Propionibacteriaceae bacterium]|nr:hypothetical protein [Propionibacteriaceae bacterium]